jgi:hypothetical protein
LWSKALWNMTPEEDTGLEMESREGRLILKASPDNSQQPSSRLDPIIQRNRTQPLQQGLWEPTMTRRVQTRSVSEDVLRRGRVKLDRKSRSWNWIRLFLLLLRVYHSRPLLTMGRCKVPLHTNSMGLIFILRLAHS